MEKLSVEDTNSAAMEAYYEDCYAETRAKAMARYGEPLTQTTTHTAGGMALTVEHTFECEMEECTEVAVTVSKLDGARICHICAEIEEDTL